MRYITPKDVMELKPCYKYERVLKAFNGKKKVTPVGYAKFKIPVLDRLWGMTRLWPEVVPSFLENNVKKCISNIDPEIISPNLSVILFNFDGVDREVVLPEDRYWDMVYCIEQSIKYHKMFLKTRDILPATECLWYISGTGLLDINRNKSFELLVKSFVEHWREMK